MKTRSLFILLSCLFTITEVLSQGIRDSVFNIGEIAVTAQQHFEKEEAGMKQTRVDTMVLKEKVNLSLSDILSENTPVFIKNHGRGALASASFRGTASSHTQVNWNGMNINSPMTGMVDFSLIPVYIIDDMNLEHGTASIRSQSGGLGGAININNKVEWDDPFGIKYMQGVGNYQTFDEFLQLHGGNRKIQAKTRLYHNYSKNNFTFINRSIGKPDPETGEITHPTDTNRNADFTRYGALQEIYFRPGTNDVVSMKWWGQWADRSLPRVMSYEGPRASENANLNQQNSRDHKILANWKHYGNKDKISLRLGYSQKDMKYLLKNFIPGQGLHNDIYSVSKQKSFLNHISYAYDINSSWSVESSLDVNWHEVASEDTVRKTGYEKKRQELSGFLSAHKSFGERLNLKLMLRQDRVDRQFAPLIPYLGFDFKVSKEHELIIRGNVAKNYRQPSLNDLYWQPGGNPDLLPEEGISMEGGLEYSKRFHKMNIRTELTAYRSDINNWIIWIPSYKGYWEPQNIQRVLSKGVELGIRLSGKTGELGYKASGNYAYTRSINYGDRLVWSDDSYGKQLVYVPVHSGNALVKLNYRKFYISYQHNSYSERFTASSNDVSRRDRLYPYFMNNLSLGKKLQWKELTFSGEFKIYNLFDESYHSVLFRPMPGRNYMFMLMMKF